jgi:hypothetical protein
MKKPRSKAPTGNPARRRHGEGAEDGKRGGWSKWVGRELNALLSLPEWVVVAIFLLLAAVALGLWRWLTPG